MMTLEEVISAISSKEEVYCMNYGSAVACTISQLIYEQNRPPKVKIGWNLFLLEDLFKKGDPTLAQALKDQAGAEVRLEGIRRDMQEELEDTIGYEEMFKSLTTIVVSYENGREMEYPVLSQGPNGYLVFADEESSCISDLDSWELMTHFAQFGKVSSITVRKP